MSCQVQKVKLFAGWLIQEQCKPAGNTYIIASIHKVEIITKK